ncbi:Aste57867_23548 [Aphanomyces stellatus]|uniref:Aste57867_23548 protein n=1 Tax=Aphanomyces stellatus TaxID=120398 RepID=A0A485LPU9_9STRA|nr:hypothetical protein As57867_023477 [Aphanomyces stellatus]VFU00193.1 Aste57867_23548 [Aphanomyces stellatus]
MNATTRLPLSTSNATVEGSPWPIDGTATLVIYAATALSLYAPCLIAIYFFNREKPAIKYHNPTEMAVAATLAFIFGFVRCIVTLLRNYMTCSIQIFLEGFSMQLTLMAFVLAKLRVILTFQLTELMAAHAEHKPVNLRHLTHLHKILRHGVVSAPWFGVQLLWNLPLPLYVSTLEYNDKMRGNCPPRVAQDVVLLYIVEFSFVFVISIGLSVLMSQVVDNFGLKQTFLTTTRILVFRTTNISSLLSDPCLVFCVAAPVTYMNESKLIETYALNLFSQLVMAHVFIYLRITVPVMRALGTDEGKDPKVFKGTAALEFMCECVVAWKAIVGYRAGGEHHMTAAAIYAQHIATTAPLPLHHAVLDHIWKRYQIAFDATTKYSIHPEMVPRTRNYFDGF